MGIEPIARTAVSDGVFAQLTEEILSGRFAPDEALPSERDLAEGFQVNRHAVREALKRLQQSRLVHISQGGKTRVLDWRRSAGLDVLLALVEAGTVPGHTVLRDIARMRRTVGADAAGLCATHGDDTMLRKVVESAAAVGIAEDPAHLVAAALRFWDHVIDGAGNLAYRLSLNTLAAGFQRMGEVNILGLIDEHGDADAHHELAAAIANRDARRAHDRAHALLSRVVHAYADSFAE